MSNNVEYKDIITYDDIKTGEIIRTRLGTYYLVIKMPRNRAKFIEINPFQNTYEIDGMVEAVFKPNGKARILPTSKKVNDD